MSDLQTIIEKAFQDRHQMTAKNAPATVIKAVQETMAQLDEGAIRVAEKQNDTWIVNEWIKKAVLLFFKINENVVSEGAYTQFYDKIPIKFRDWSEHEFHASGIRVVPPATVRQGTYLAPNTILMPSFVNIGAYIDSGTMIDTWATVGSCAQIGKNVHISGGVGIGGVLEPLQTNPTIIEDHCFIGARSEIVEGVIVEENSVISMGVFIGQSTPIYNRDTKEIIHGRVPKGSVVIAGSLPSRDGSYSRYAAIIVKQVDPKTRSKVSLNELLRIEEIPS
ncbi:MAG: 2,3,4,5-tetrahydropyridine-2,6-dicarboxylate N-succinyltransferase [Coxiella sp. RIFCSPHIGHO2_12_FULL_42_15]|nr:MAG: 2,3,4,5-tetrahydropyridine-2,6-dicarboxylate N-succinyltransferase [Coxiella sp. RIFCSPHIGHO2_12_FULL_42_15]